MNDASVSPSLQSSPIISDLPQAGEVIAALGAGIWRWNPVTGEEFLDGALQVILASIGRWEKPTSVSSLLDPECRRRIDRSLVEKQAFHCEIRDPAGHAGISLHIQGGISKTEPSCVVGLCFLAPTDSGDKPCHGMEAWREHSESDERLRIFVQDAPVGVAMLDRNMRYVAHSRRWLTDYGLSEQSLVGRSHYEVFPDIPERWRAIHRTCLTGVPQRCEEDSFERADGSKHFLRWEIQPWRTASNEVGGLLFFTEMITERVLAQRALQESKERLAEAQRIARVGSWEYDIARGCFFWSDEVYQLLEVAPEVIQPSYEASLSFVHAEERDMVAQAYQDSLKHGTPFQIVHRVVVAGNRIKFVRETAVTSYSPEGLPLYSRGTVQDITAEMLTADCLRAAIQEKDMLLREIHHRVKNNLQIISSLLYFQAKKTSDPVATMAFEEARERLRSISLVHEKLYSSPTLAEIDFEDYIRSLAAETAKSAMEPSGRITFHLETVSLLLPITVALPCGMILVELVSNIVKHAFSPGRHGNATIRVSHRPNLGVLTVEDDGAGLPLDFDPGSTETYGWQLIRSLTKQIDGSLKVERLAGTSVTLSFPLNRGV